MSREKECIGKYIEVNSAVVAMKGLSMMVEPGILLTDVDGPMKRFSFGLINYKLYSALMALGNKDWEIAVVSNQSTKGHIVARGLGAWLGLPNYPDCFLERGWPVFGGDWDFLWNHYKGGRKSVNEIGAFVDGCKNNGCLAMVGDEESDIAFFNALVGDLKSRGCQRESLFLKTPFLGMTGINGPILRRLQTIIP